MLIFPDINPYTKCSYFYFLFWKVMGLFIATIWESLFNHKIHKETTAIWKYKNWETHSCVYMYSCVPCLSGFCEMVYNKLKLHNMNPQDVG